MFESTAIYIRCIQPRQSMYDQRKTLFIVVCDVRIFTFLPVHSFNVLDCDGIPNHRLTIGNLVKGQVAVIALQGLFLRVIFPSFIFVFLA